MERHSLKKCKDCGKEIVANKYTPRRGLLCPDCSRLHNNAAKKKSRCLKKYGVSVETYDRVMSIGHCEICGSEDDLVYDHDHATMKPRGCLCRNCNRAIGQLGDSLEAIQKAVRYLEVH